MTRKNYIRLAADLSVEYRRVLDDGEVCVFWAVVNTVADELQRDNPQFDRFRFIEAVKG